jgi:hypothetical protein
MGKRMDRGREYMPAALTMMLNKFFVAAAARTCAAYARHPRQDLQIAQLARAIADIDLSGVQASDFAGLQTDVSPSPPLRGRKILSARSMATAAMATPISSTIDTSRCMDGP